MKGMFVRWLAKWLEFFAWVFAFLSVRFAGWTDKLNEKRK